MLPLCLCTGDVDYRVVLLVLSLAVGGHSGDLVGPARWGITHVYESGVVSFTRDSWNLH